MIFFHCDPSAKHHAREGNLQEPPPWRRRKELRQRQDCREPRARSGGVRGEGAVEFERKRPMLPWPSRRA